MPAASILKWLQEREWSVLAVLGALWFPALFRFSAEWRITPQYHYGWLVPVLAAYLLYDRWTARPALDPGADSHPVVSSLCCAALVFFAAWQLPLRFLGEADYGWRALSWVVGLQMVSISLIILFLWGGVRWARYFAFPFIFLATSIPWHFMMEQWTVQSLMRTNASIAAGLVSLTGVPVEAAGNVIYVPNGVLGVDEACSGIRSLQSTLAAALFLAGLFRLGIVNGIFLVASGISIAFAGNVVRTTFLTWQGAMHGTAATGEWHDTAGFTILGVVLICLWFMAQVLERLEEKGRA